MILQRTSSLSCAATPLPQTFATGRFLPQFALGNRYANLHQEPRLMSLLPPHLPDGLPTTLASTTTSAPVVPCTRSEGLTVGTRINKAIKNAASNHLVRPFTGFHHRWLDSAPEDKSLHRGKRNRRAQPPRLACPRTARPGVPLPQRNPTEPPAPRRAALT